MKKAGRVHWLLWHLSADFCRAYSIHYNYLYHNYSFVRYTGRSVLDMFIVQQTSRHYWQVMYVNVKTQHYEHFGYRRTKYLAEKMEEIYRETLVQ